MDHQYHNTVVEVARALAYNQIKALSTEAAATALNVGPPALRILKSQVGAGNLGDPEWAGGLADMQAASSVFLQSLGGRSAFAALLDQDIITRAPLHSKVGANISAVVGAVTGEGSARPISRMTLNGDVLIPQRADALIVLTEDVITKSSPASKAFVGRQMRRAIGKALDTSFHAALVAAGVTETAATASKNADLLAALNAVNTGEGRLAWLASTDVANRLAVADQIGRTSPEGVSEFLNLPFAVSAGVPDSTLVLLNGDQVVADIVSLGVSTTRHASVQMDDAPTNSSVTPTPTNLTSLWQANSIGIKLSALFAAKAGTTGAAYILTGVAWS